MKPVSPTLQNLLDSSPPDRPEITKAQYNVLPRVERLYYGVIYPRFFRLSSGDEEYLDLIKQTYNIMIQCGAKDEDSEEGAKVMIKHMVPNYTLQMPQILELMRDAKSFFGKIVVTDIEFDRHILRKRLWDLAERAKKDKDFYCERLALKELIKLDGLAVSAKKDEGPVIPPLPEIEYTTKYEESDAAIILSSPEEEAMD